jgi:hypothetical protein
MKKVLVIGSGRTMDMTFWLPQAAVALTTVGGRMTRGPWEPSLFPRLLYGRRYRAARKVSTSAYRPDDSNKRYRCAPWSKRCRIFGSGTAG